MSLLAEDWFGPKPGGGWGWTPVTWQGWLAVALCLAALVAIHGYARPKLGAPVAAALGVGAIAVLLGVTILTGSPPG